MPLRQMTVSLKGNRPGGAVRSRAGLMVSGWLLLSCFGLTAWAQSEPTVQSGGRVEAEVYHDTSPPLWLIPPAPRPSEPRIHRVLPLPRPRPPAPGVAVTQADAVLQSFPGQALMPTTSLNFDGVGNGFSGPQGTFSVSSAPPDTNGDVGPNHYVQMVSTDFAVFNKSGTAIYGPVPINTLWSGFGGGCQTNNDGDPVVLYDPIADRWVISQFSVSTTPYLQCVAVSQTPDPTGAYYRYAFSYGSTDFPDYPKMGVWPDAYYETFNIFANAASFSGARVCAYDRASMLAGQAATQQCFNTTNTWGGLLPSDLDGSRLPPAGSPNYSVAFGTNDLGYWKFHVDWTTPANSTFTGPTTLAVAAFTDACNDGTCIPQSGTTQKLDSLGDRLMYRLAYRNFGDHEALVVNHSINAGSSVGVRWYELRADSSHSLSLFQQGTYAPDSNYRWMGSIAMDQAGNIALGFSVSGSSLHPEIHYTGRLAGDPAGQMAQGEGTIIDGAGSQTGSGLSRWGDYSSISVDPSDDCTFWYTNEYIPANGAFNWSTRVGTFKFPGCGPPPANDFSISANPSSLSLQQGTSGTSTISTAVVSGSAETVNLTVTGAPSGATASLNPTSVTAGNSSTLTVNAGTAAAGTYTLTVTGTAPSATHSTAVTLTVTVPPNDFSISANPNSLNLQQGASGRSTILTAVTSGSAQTVNLSVSGVPSGANASLNPTSVTAGNSSTLTVNAGSALPGTYTLPVTGTGASTTHSTTVTLTVDSVIVNGGFETGDLTGWSSVGTASVVAGGHSGNYAAQVGATTPTSNSAIVQTFMVPASGGTLSFWYQVHCPDTVIYDWAAAGFRDNVTGAITILLPPTCTNTGTWIQVGANLGANAGHSITLVLVNHDDNYPADPTYTLYDDVSLGPPPPSPIINGGFENGLTGWTSTGTTALSTTAHSGSFSAQVGSTSPSGNSSLAQTFTVPVSGGTLSFWYQVHCPDTVTYDWASVTIKDNVTGSTTTVLGGTCTNNGAWVQKTFNLGARAGHRVTLTLHNHDDNYPGDPTFTLYDDVSFQ